jgi:hypothetical protein
MRSPKKARFLPGFTRCLVFAGFLHRKRQHATNIGYCSVALLFVTYPASCHHARQPAKAWVCQVSLPKKCPGAHSKNLTAAAMHRPESSSSSSSGSSRVSQMTRHVLLRMYTGLIVSTSRQPPCTDPQDMFCGTHADKLMHHRAQTWTPLYKARPNMDTCICTRTSVSVCALTTTL